jgi:hypothetical protein
MAFDTANRRYAAVGVGLDFMRVRPEPDATLSTEDRLHLLPLLTPIAAGEPTVGEDTARRRIRPGGPKWRRWRLLYEQGA